MYGIDLDLLTMDDLVEACDALVQGRRLAQQTSLNAGKVVLMEDDRRVRAWVAESDLVTADGQSIVWAGRLLGHHVPERVAGIDLMGRLLDLAERKGYPVYLLGARSDVLTAFIGAVEVRYPDLEIAGFSDGFFEDAEKAADDIRCSGARLLFLAMPSPMKESFVSNQRDRLGPILAVGVGGSFDVWAGRTARAPQWMQRCGLEWFYRLVQEPRRMWKRYLIGNLRFVGITLRESVRRPSERDEK